MPWKGSEGRTYDTPPRRDIQSFALLVGGAEVFESVEGEGDVHEAGAFVVFVFSAGHVNEGDAVVLVIVGDECQVVVGMHDFSTKKVAVEALHMIEACGFQHYVRKLRWRDHFVVSVC